ncbi:MAG: DUF222 domain-containing protein [Gordonia sp. (in: high G+C Gram-positive bacteria)]|uniref:HNH endonuclease signature motif containing protein n=1 Tax=Gordonia sp. (in: high G+C Gram-positive bacteria) TaxID=84139 RepID=UPI0039E6AE06
MVDTANEVLSAGLPDSPVELARVMDAVAQKLADAKLGLLTDAAVQSTVETLETTRRRMDGVDAAFYVEVSDRQVFLRTGNKKPRDFYAQYLRLGAAEARRREDVAASIGRLSSMTGEKLPPRRELLAELVAAGEASGHHVREVEKVMAKLPHAATTRDTAYAVKVMSEMAPKVMPEAMVDLGARILAHLDPDGTLTDDEDRQRQRGLTLGRQDTRGMTAVSGSITPTARALLEVLLDNWAKPGMNNPDDENSIDGSAAELGAEDRDALADAAARDRRSAAQRNHDALEKGLEWILGHGGLGPPARLPAELVITVDEADLARRAGVATTATGTLVPVGNLIDLAAEATPWLEVFAAGTRQVLDLYRGARIASKAQRLALFGRDRGCTRPMCPRPASQCQAHHATKDWADGGLTNIGDLTLACGPDNRNVGTNPDQWETTPLTTGPDTGRTGWRLTGSSEPYRTNPVHDPESFVRGILSGGERFEDPDPPPVERPTPPMRRARPEEWEAHSGANRQVNDDFEPVEAEDSRVEAALEAILAVYI